MLFVLTSIFKAHIRRTFLTVQAHISFLCGSTVCAAVRRGILRKTPAHFIFVRRTFSTSETHIFSHTPFRGWEMCGRVLDCLSFWVSVLEGKPTWNDGGVFGKRDPNRTLARAKTFSEFGMATQCV